jgi:hypothetical protein
MPFFPTKLLQLAKDQYAWVNTIYASEIPLNTPKEW